MVGMLLGAIENDFCEFVIFIEFKSHIIDFVKYLRFRVLNNDFDSSIRSGISNLDN